MNVEILSPNKKIIEKYLDKWNNLEEHYIWQESSLDKLFHEDYKTNTNLNEILIKCSCLNDFYSTNIFLIFPMAKNIYDLKIDKRLKEGDATLVNDIANVMISGKQKCFYSFASKYCSHHNEMEFPIFDYYVEKMLMYLKKKDKFANFIQEDLKDYVKFKNILLELKRFYNIDEYNLRDIDKYLWIAGKEYFTKRY